MSAPPRTVEPVRRQVDPDEHADPAEDDGDDPARRPAPARLRRRLGEPALLTTCFSSRVSNPVTSLPSVRSSLGSMSSVPPPMFRSRLEQELGALVHRPRASPLEARHLHRVLRRRLRRADRELRALRDEAGLLRLELDQAARGEVEARRRERPARRLAVADDRAGGGGQAGRRRRDVDRRVVEVDGVAPVAVPRDQRAADEQHEQQRRDEQAERRVELPEEVQGPGVLGGRGGVDLLHRHQQRAVEVAALEQRQHVVLVDLLALGVRQELVANPGPAYSCTWPWHGSSALRSNRITRPSSKPFRPTPHWSISDWALCSAVGVSSQHGVSCV